MITFKKTRINLRENDVLFFHHIPKTAGSSLHYFLQNHFNHEDTCFEQYAINVLTKPPSQLWKYKFIYGHHSYHLTDLLIKNPITITMLRDPVKRTLSHFNHLTRLIDLKTTVPWESLQQQYSPSGSTLEELLETPEWQLFFITNYQVRFITSDKYIDNWFDYPKQTRIEIAKRIRDDETLLKRAKERLKKYAFVGLTERYEDSLHLLCYLFGWYPGKVTKYNESPIINSIHLNDLTSKTIQQIDNLVCLDKELYSFAKNLFENHLGNLNYHSVIKRYEKQLTRKKPIQAIHLSMNEPNFVEGWYQKEIEDTGAMFRWTGPHTESILDLFLDKKKNYSIIFRVEDSLELSIIKSLELFVNDIPIELSILLFLSPRQIVFRGDINKKALSERSYTRITFKVSHTTSPQELGQLDDDRKLGLKFLWIDILSAK